MSFPAIFAIRIASAQQQKFKVTPHDLQVLEGSEAVLRCEVAYLAGQVQWTKDGFALGKLINNQTFLIYHFMWYFNKDFYYI